VWSSEFHCSTAFIPLIFKMLFGGRKIHSSYYNGVSFLIYTEGKGTAQRQAENPFR